MDSTPTTAAVVASEDQKQHPTEDPLKESEECRERNGRGTGGRTSHVFLPEETDKDSDEDGSSSSDSNDDEGGEGRSGSTTSSESNNYSRTLRGSLMVPTQTPQQSILNQIQLLKSALPTQAELALVYDCSAEEGKKFERYVQGIIRKIHALEKERADVNRAAGGPEERRRAVRSRHSKQLELSHMTAVYEFLNKEAVVTDRAQEYKDRQQQARTMEAMKREGLLAEAKAKRDEKEKVRLKKLEDNHDKWSQHVSKAMSEQQRVSQDAKRIRELRMEKLANVERVTYLGPNDQLPHHPPKNDLMGSFTNRSTADASSTSRAAIQSDAHKRAIEEQQQRDIDAHLKRAELMKRHRTNVANSMVGHVKELLSHVKERRAEEDELKYQQLQEKCAEADDRFRGVVQRRADVIKTLRKQSSQKRQKVEANREAHLQREEEKRLLIGAECERRLALAGARLLPQEEELLSEQENGSVTSDFGTLTMGGSPSVSHTSPTKHVSNSFYEQRRGKLKMERFNERAAQRAAEAAARKEEATRLSALKLMERTTRVGDALGVTEVPEKAPTVKNSDDSDAKATSSPVQRAPRKSLVELEEAKKKKQPTPAQIARAEQRNQLAERARERIEAAAGLRKEVQRPTNNAASTHPRNPSAAIAASPAASSSSLPHEAPKTTHIPLDDAPPPVMHAEENTQQQQPADESSSAQECDNQQLPYDDESVAYLERANPFCLPTLGYLLRTAPPLSSIPLDTRTVANELHTLRTMYLTMRQESTSPST